MTPAEAIKLVHGIDAAQDEALVAQIMEAGAGKLTPDQLTYLAASRTFWRDLAFVAIESAIAAGGALSEIMQKATLAAEPPTDTRN